MTYNFPTNCICTRFRLNRLPSSAVLVFCFQHSLELNPLALYIFVPQAPNENRFLERVTEGLRGAQRESKLGAYACNIGWVVVRMSLGPWSAIFFPSVSNQVLMKDFNVCTGRDVFQVAILPLGSQAMSWGLSGTNLPVPLGRVSILKILNKRWTMKFLLSACALLARDAAVLIDEVHIVVWSLYEFTGVLRICDYVHSYGSHDLHSNTKWSWDSNLSIWLNHT